MNLTDVPVAPHRLPLAGHLARLARDPVGFLTSLRDKGSIVGVNLGPLRVYVLTDAALANQVLVERGRSFAKGKLFDEVRPLLGDGLLTSGRELHLRQRRVIQQVFHRERLANYATTMRDRARSLAASWHAGQRLRVDHVMVDFALNTLLGTIFASEITQSTTDTIRRSLRTIERGVLMRTITPRPLLVLSGADRRFTAVARRLRGIIDELIERDRGDENLLRVLLDARDPETGERIDPELVRDELASFLAAGTETTSSTLAWVFHEMGRDPALDQRVHDDDNVLRAVISETLRLYSLPMLMRRAVEPVEIGGVLLPTGTEVLFSPAALHRDPDIFPDPLRFSADRWLTTAPPRECFLPFGNGTRRCIGETFALTEIAIAVREIVRRWRLIPVPGKEVRAVAHATTYPNRLPMTVAPRH
ncbi:cytochrome P450 [Allokutzneria sp. A3M-2-11 16]|nr:cytochrome P450 [Allokutzneria sp. A3M-2-11 16]